MTDIFQRKTFLIFESQLDCNLDEAKELDKDTWFLGIHVLPHQGTFVAKYSRLDRALHRLVCPRTRQYLWAIGVMILSHLRITFAWSIDTSMMAE